MFLLLTIVCAIMIGILVNLFFAKFVSKPCKECEKRKREDALAVERPPVLQEEESID